MVSSQSHYPPDIDQISCNYIENSQSDKPQIIDDIDSNAYDINMIESTLQNQRNLITKNEKLKQINKRLFDQKLTAFSRIKNIEKQLKTSKKNFRKRHTSFSNESNTKWSMINHISQATRNVNIARLDSRIT